MHKRVKVGIYSLLLLVITIGIILLYKSYTKPSYVDVSNIENVEKISIEEVLTMFKNNNKEANIAFTEKVIEVEGVIKDISFLNDRHTIILNSESFTQSFVMCDMSPMGNDEIKELSIGDTIVLRGVCKGYLLDVIMLNCMPIDEKTKQ